MKYRYFMGGSFSPETYENVHKNTEFGDLGIVIPAPFTRDSEEEALQDQEYAYRFVSDGETVLVAIYPKEDFCPSVDDKGRKCLNIWTEGAPFHFYTYEEFVRLGGLLHEIPEFKGIPLDSPAAHAWHAEDYKVEVSFAALFPSLKPEDRPVYIDNEAYRVDEVTVVDDK